MRDNVTSSTDRGRSSVIIDLIASETIVVTVIIINSIVLFVEFFPQSPLDGSVTQTIDWIITIYFILEMTAKIIKFGVKKFFRSKENTFDFLLVFISSFALLSPFVGSLSASDLYLLRLVRIIKIIRLLKFVPHRVEVYSGIFRALKASGAVLLYLSLMIFVYAMFGTSMFGESVPEHFGNPMKSMYTVFSIFMIEGWNTIPDEAVKLGIENAYWLRFFFIVVLVTGGFMGISFANAVFVDEMVIDNNDAMSRELQAVKELNIRQSEQLDTLASELYEIKNHLASLSRPEP